MHKWLLQSEKLKTKEKEDGLEEEPGTKCKKTKELNIKGCQESISERYS